MGENDRDMGPYGEIRDIELVMRMSLMENFIMLVSKWYHECDSTTLYLGSVVAATTHPNILTYISKFWVLVLFKVLTSIFMAWTSHNPLIT